MSGEDDGGLIGKALASLLLVFLGWLGLRWFVRKLAEHSDLLVGLGVGVGFLVLCVILGGTLGKRAEAMEKWEKALKESSQGGALASSLPKTVRRGEEAVRASAEGVRQAREAVGRAKPVLDGLAARFREAAERECLKSTELEIDSEG